MLFHNLEKKLVPKYKLMLKSHYNQFDINCVNCPGYISVKPKDNPQIDLSVVALNNNNTHTKAASDDVKRHINNKYAACILAFL
jgi:hypothetical protein